MKVGDLIKSKTRYAGGGVAGQKFLVIGTRTAGHNLQKNGVIRKDRTQVRAIRMPDGFKTRWSNIETWEVISESR
jgi:hypothetical protein